MEPFLYRLLVGVLVLTLVKYIIDTFIHEANANKILWIITIIAVVIYIVFGQLLGFV